MAGGKSGLKILQNDSRRRVARGVHSEVLQSKGQRQKINRPRTTSSISLLLLDNAKQRLSLVSFCVCVKSLQRVKKKLLGETGAGVWRRADERRARALPPTLSPPPETDGCQQCNIVLSILLKIVSASNDRMVRVWSAAAKTAP